MPYTAHDESNEKARHVRRFFLLFCPSCQRKHRMVWEACPVCGGRSTAQPASEAVYNKCRMNYRCGSCDAVHG